MTALKASLRRAALHYEGGMSVHTASSGKVDALDALYLVLDDGDVRGIGEVRLNIAYLTGLSPEAIIQGATDFLNSTPLPADGTALRAFLEHWPDSIPSSVRMMVDTAIHDLLARREGKSVSRLLGADHPVTYRTNQTLFFSDEPTFRRRSEAYVARGFRDLKIRIGQDLDADIARFRWLRDRFHGDIRLAADANGAWTSAEATEAFQRLAAFDLDYVEQPVPAGNWDALAALAEISPIPIMLDESLAAPADCRTLAGLGAPLMAHLKLVKLGGLLPLFRAANMLKSAGIPLMIGQMNEGTVATAAALHAASALQPRFAELYGADGLNDDPATGLAYENGSVSLVEPHARGLGLTFDTDRTALLMETC